MNLDHYLFLYPSYGIAVLGWVLYRRYGQTNLGNAVAQEGTIFKRPRMEFAYAILAVIGIILVGQLFVHGYLLQGGFIADAVNQILIFTPMFLLLLIRKQNLDTALLPQEGKLKSIVIGLILAFLALLVFLLLKGYDFEGILGAFSFIYLNPENLDSLVQVFAEDFAISVLLFRLVQWIGLKRSILIVASLFAIGHIPAMISNGVSIENFIGLIFDTLLGVLILKTVYQSKNFLWFWMIHFAMDMTQFLG